MRFFTSLAGNWMRFLSVCRRIRNDKPTFVSKAREKLRQSRNFSLALSFINACHSERSEESHKRQSTFYDIRELNRFKCGVNLNESPSFVKVAIEKLRLCCLLTITLSLVNSCHSEWSLRNEPVSPRARESHNQ